jgi:hypothetical protein
MYSFKKQATPYSFKKQVGGEKMRKDVAARTKKLSRRRAVELEKAGTVAQTKLSSEYFA